MFLRRLEIFVVLLALRQGLELRWIRQINQFDICACPRRIGLLLGTLELQHIVNSVEGG